MDGQMNKWMNGQAVVGIIMSRDITKVEKYGCHYN